MKQSTKFKKEVHKARKNARSIPEFFEEYTKILQDMYGVTMNITGTPGDIFDKESSHNSPIDKPQAWTSNDLTNPNIPNTYKAYIGRVSGTTNFNDNSHKSFEATSLFWAFGDLCIDFFNGSPNQSYYKTENGIETFDFDIILFVEDFPKIYEKYRKVHNIEILNKAFDNVLNIFIDNQRKNLQQAQKESEALAEIELKRKQMHTIIKKLDFLQADTENYIKNELNKKGVCLPKIDNAFLNTDRYNRILDSHIINDTPRPDELEVMDKINTALNNFDDYKEKFIEDFL